MTVILGHLAVIAVALMVSMASTPILGIAIIFAALIWQRSVLLHEDSPSSQN